MLAHVVDCATLEPGRDPVSDVDALEAELAAYQPALAGDAGLGDLADRGLVSLRRGRIIVRDPATLRELADSGGLSVATGGYQSKVMR